METGLRLIKAFLRNDDVRNSIDDSLEYLTRRAIETGIPITHAVEPANTNDSVAAWLSGLCKKHPDRIGIIQHGCDHRIKTPAPYRGEFGKGRSLEAQLGDITRGAAMMDALFENQWTRIFSFPYGAYDTNTLKALELSNFKTITTGVRLTPKRRLFNSIGRLLRRKKLMGQNIVYFNERIPGFSLHEMPVILNNMKQQTGPDTAVQKTAQELHTEWKRLPSSVKTRGLLCHHRFNDRNDIDHLITFLDELKSDGVAFFRIEDLA